MAIASKGRVDFPLRRLRRQLSQRESQVSLATHCCSSSYCCGCQLPYEYSVSAGGFPVFRPVLRDCRALLRKARNDKSRAFTVLTIVCQFRRYSAGPGCPLPYNITSHCKRAGLRVRPFSILLFHFHSAQDIDGAHAHTEVPALGIGVKIQVDLIALDAAADVLGHAVAIDILAVV